MKRILSSLALSISMLSINPSFAFANDGSYLPLANQTIAKITNPNELGKLFLNAQPNSRQRVIVTLATSTISAAENMSGQAYDALLKAENKRAQAAVMDAVFGSASSALSNAQVSETNMVGMDYSPQMVLSLTAAEIDAMAANANVLAIEVDTLSRAIMDQSTVRVEIGPVWANNGTGRDRVVAVLDTGAKKAHEFITPARIAAEACFNSNVSSFGATSQCPGGVEVSTAAGSGEDCAPSTSGCSHGTHVSGTAIGFNSNRQSGEPTHGMAYEAKLLSINVFTKFDNNTATTNPVCRTGQNPCVLSFSSDQLAALNHIYSLRNTYNIDSVNMSLGGSATSFACPTNSLASIIGLLRAAKIATVIAAGNSGLNSQVGSPSCIPDAITVASSLDTADTRSSFSNWGNLIDLVAPGSNIQSSVYGSSAGATSSYSNYNGTSMATPHVAGAFAALRSLYPNATVDEIENALKSSGVGITSAGVTKPRIRMNKACEVLGGGTCVKRAEGPIFSSILPTGRGTNKDRAVTAFANILNAGSGTAEGCRLTSSDTGGSLFSYQTTNAANQLVGSINTPADIPAGQIQNFFFSVEPKVTTTQRSVTVGFVCDNTPPAPTVPGLTTFVYSARAFGAAHADMLAISATIGSTGYLEINGSNGVGLASITALNNASSATIRAVVTEQALGGIDPNMPANLQICRSNSSGICVTSYGNSTTFNATPGTPYFFLVKATGTGGAVADNPATNRAHIYFQDTSDNSYVGATSVSVRTK